MYHHFTVQESTKDQGVCAMKRELQQYNGQNYTSSVLDFLAKKYLLILLDFYNIYYLSFI